MELIKVFILIFVYFLEIYSVTAKTNKYIVKLENLNHNQFYINVLLGSEQQPQKLIISSGNSMNFIKNSNNTERLDSQQLNVINSKSFHNYSVPVAHSVKL